MVSAEETASNAGLREPKKGYAQLPSSCEGNFELDT